MDFHDIDWARAFCDQKRNPDRTKAGSDAARELWNGKAPSFAHKPSRSSYTEQLLALMDIDASDTLLDVGCGSGSVAVPLAADGHAVVALDLSPAMLDELESYAAEEHVTVKRVGRISDPARSAALAMPGSGGILAAERSWQESWADVPAADVAVSSRSLLTEDLAESILKLESHARKRVFVTVGAGNLPYRDREILRALGRTDIAGADPSELVCLVNYLFSLGRLPRIDYISYERVWRRDTREELIESVRDMYLPRTPEEESGLDAYLAQHTAFHEASGQFELDRPRTDRWACVSWDVPQRAKER